MAKSISSLVIPIICLVVFALVEENMGCITSIGMCGEDIKDCDSSCKTKLGQKATGLCNLKKNLGQCLCSHPCSAARRLLLHQAPPAHTFSADTSRHLLLHQAPPAHTFSADRARILLHQAPPA